MNMERYVRLIAGLSILVSLILSIWVNSWWLILATFVATALVISGLTGWCFVENVLGKLGVKASRSFNPDKNTPEEKIKL